jgi:hypothetical protein
MTTYGIPKNFVKIRETIYSSNGSWAPNPSTQIVDVDCVGTGGSGGGSFNAGSTDQGSAGGGGDRIRRRFFVASLTNNVSITCQAAPGTTPAATDGTNGGYAAFGPYVTAYGGAGGSSGGGAGSGGGGGPMGGGLTPNFTATQGGAPGAGGQKSNPGFGGGGGSGGTGNPMAGAVWGGASGGFAATATIVTYVGARTFLGAGGGGAGGNFTDAINAGDGGSSGPWTTGDVTTTGGGGTGGTGGHGTSGINGADGDGFRVGAGGGGGDRNTGGAGGNGGAGGFPGGGGGGGGNDSTGTLNGTGGAAGGSQVRVTEWGPPKDAPQILAQHRAPGFPRKAPIPGIPRLGVGLLQATSSTVVTTPNYSLYFGSGTTQ